MIDKDNIVSVEKCLNSINRTFSNMYKVIYNADKECFVPLDETNTDYQAIQEWAKIEGNNIIDPGA